MIPEQNIIVIMLGSVGAVFGAFVSNKTASLSGEVAAMVAFSGVLTAIGGVIGQLSSNIVAVFKIWADTRRAERLEKLDRAQLIDRIEHNNIMIKDLRTILDEYRDRVESQKSRLDDQHRFIESFYQWKANPLPDENSIKPTLKTEVLSPAREAPANGTTAKEPPSEGPSES